MAGAPPAWAWRGWAVWLWRRRRSAHAGRWRLLIQTEVGFSSVPLPQPSIGHPEGFPQSGTWGAGGEASGERPPPKIEPHQTARVARRASWRRQQG